MMNHPLNDMTGYILAGGKSSRMGMDKGLMQLNGQPIIKYVITQLQPVVHKLVIVSNNPEYEKFGFEVIADPIKERGPAGGIYTALNHSDSAINFIVSCDMPFITTAGMQYIVQQQAQSQIILPMHEQKLEPLFGVYSKACLKKWLALIEQGTFKLQDMVVQFDLKKIHVDNNNLFTDHFFMNINTKTDLEKAINLT